MPPVFERCATVGELDLDDDALLVEQERAVLRQPADLGPPGWWLGHLDTGAHDVVLPTARRVTMDADRPYVVVQAGSDEALTWRDSPPDLVSPDDRSRLMSMLWDDGWTCVGGPARLIEALVADPLIRARAVGRGVDATPWGQRSS